MVKLGERDYLQRYTGLEIETLSLDARRILRTAVGRVAGVEVCSWRDAALRVAAAKGSGAGGALCDP